jgi:hypothetical protein
MRVTSHPGHLMRFTCELANRRRGRNAGNDESQNEGKTSTHYVASIANYSGQERTAAHGFFSPRDGGQG